MVVNKPESPPPPFLKVGLRCLFLYVCVVFSECDAVHYIQTSPPCSLLSEAHWSKSSVICCKPGAHVFSWQPFQTCHACSVFFIVLWWTLTFNMLAEACRVWCVALHFFVRFFCSFTEHCMGSGFVFRLRLVTVLNVFLLWIIFLTPGWWNCLRMPS